MAKTAAEMDDEAGEPTLVSMKRTGAEKKASNDCMPCAEQDYPYGLAINLGKDELAKLGVSQLPPVGAEYELTAVVKVTAVNQSASEGREATMSCSLQITAMALEDEPAPPPTRKPAAKAAPAKPRGARAPTATAADY